MKKIKIETLKVSSFVTDLKEKNIETVKGGRKNVVQSNDSVCDSMFPCQPTWTEGILCSVVACI